MELILIMVTYVKGLTEYLEHNQQMIVVIALIDKIIIVFALHKVLVDSNFDACL